MNGPLDRCVGEILAQIAQLTAAPVPTGAPLQIRLAVTRPDPGGGGYPNPATSPDTYWIRFVDGTFTEAQGSQVVTKYQRSTNPTVVARNVNGSASFVQQDSLVLAVRYSGRWWFSYSAPGMNLYPVYFNANLARGGSASVTIMQWNAGLGVLQATGANVTAYDVCSSGPANQFDIGYVVLNPDSSRYEIVELPSRSSVELYLFYLNAALARGGSASATLRQWAAPPVAGGPWAATGANVIVYDSSSLGPAPQATDATKQSGVCWLNPDSGRYEIITLTTRLGVDIFPCYFNADLARGSNASAMIGAWSGAAWDLTGNPQTVYDEGRVGPAKQGWRGWVFQSPSSGRWELLNIERSPSALWIEYQVDWDFDYGTRLFQVSVKRFWEGPDPGPHVMVENVGPTGKYVFRGKAGARGRAQYDRYTGGYRNDWTECPDGPVNEPSVPPSQNEPPPYNPYPDFSNVASLSGAAPFA